MTIPKAKVQDFADQLLHTDCAMIAQNSSHVVLSVRVSREFLAANHSMLLCLSEAACGNKALPAKILAVPDKPRSARIPRALNGLLTAVSTIGAITLAWGLVGSVAAGAWHSSPTVVYERCGLGNIINATPNLRPEVIW